MKPLRLHPADSQKMLLRLRVHVRCMFVAGVLGAVIHIGTHVPMSPAASNETIAVVTISPSGVKSVMPAGWRRTKNGWEHVSTWTNLGLPTTSSINELISQQQAREPQWIRVAMARLSRVPPLMIAVMQITAIAAIVFVSESRRRERKNADRS